MMIVSIVLWCLLLFQLNSITRVSSNKTDIHIGGLIPYLFNDRFSYHAAISYAVEQINARDDILQNYTLNVHYRETFGQSSHAIESLYDLIYTQPTKIALLGPAYSGPTVTVADASTLWATNQITYAALQPELLNRARFPFFARSTPSMHSFNRAKIGFLKNFNWKRVGIIYDYTSTLYFATVDALQKELKAEGFTVLSIEGFSSDFGQTATNQIKKLKELGARIIFGEFSNSGARRVFCEAYLNDMVDQNYVWITPNSLSSTWLTDLRLYNVCSTEQLRIAADRRIVTDRLELRDDNVTTIGGITAEQFMTELERRRPGARSLASFAYDATWILALGMEKASQTRNLSTFTYKDFSLGRTFSGDINSVNFEAISGPLSFDESGERLGKVRILQYRNGTTVEIAKFDSIVNNISFVHNEEMLMWNGKPIPRDFPMEVREEEIFSIAMVAVLWTIACLGFIAAGAFLYLNIRHRKNKLIKMSSPMINNIIIFGCMLCYISVITFGIDGRLVSKEKLPAVCEISSWTLSIGFTLSFGALFSKTWRVYKIFTAARSMEKVAILDWHLFGIIFMLFVIDVIILITWKLISPFHVVIHVLKSTTNVFEDIVYTPFHLSCNSDHQFEFMVSQYAYKGFLLLFGLFLAWETRKVKVSALNDSKYIGMSVYNVVAISAVAVTCVSALNNAENFAVSYVIVALSINLCTTVTLCLVFVPKLQLFFNKRNSDNPTKKVGVNGYMSSDYIGSSHKSVVSSRCSSFIDKQYSNSIKRNKPNGMNGHKIEIKEDASEFRQSQAWSSVTDISRMSLDNLANSPNNTDMNSIAPNSDSPNKRRMLNAANQHTNSLATIPGELDDQDERLSLGSGNSNCSSSYSSSKPPSEGTDTTLVFPETPNGNSESHLNQD